MGKNILSLFSGIECGAQAFLEEGIEVDNWFSSEVDETAKAIAKMNHPYIQEMGDITLIDVNRLKNLPKIDWVIGGSPCQSFSSAGTQEGFKGKSGLFYEYLRIVKWIVDNNNKNVKILLENVVMKEDWENVITNSLKSVVDGIRITPINSKHFGAQNRPRLYWTNFEINKYTTNDEVIENVLDTWVDKKYNLSERGIRGNLKSKFQDRQPYSVKQKCGTLKIGGNKKNIVKDWDYWKSLNENSTIDFDRLGARNLTPTEYEQLQHLPINYTQWGNFNGFTKQISDTQRYKTIGNGWDVKVIKHIINGQ